MLLLQIIAILAPKVAERSSGLSHYIEWTSKRIGSAHSKFLERYLTGYQTAAQPTKRTVTKMRTKSQG